MVKAMGRRLLEKALKRHRCRMRKPDTGPHSTWDCPCGLHTAYIPRHKEISPGVISDTIERLKCLPKGWTTR